jgi:hypothetical protein
MKKTAIRLYGCVLGVTLGVLAASPASAQYRPRASFNGSEAIGEDYYIEAAYSWWNAEPSLIVNSESLGIVGSNVDLVTDLGIEKKRLAMFDVVLRPGRKHRFRYQRLPIKYETDAFPVTREFVFNGQRYRVGLPVTTLVDFTTHRFGYEYDFIYTRRGFFGALVDVKYTNVDVALDSPIGNEFVSATAPVPTFGFAGRGYVVPNVAINGEITFFRTPGSLQEQLEGNASYTDFDIHGTVNVNKNVGVKLGYRRTSVFYDVELDTGDLKFKGLYFGGVVRY